MAGKQLSSYYADLSLYQILQKIYPEYDWQESEFRVKYDTGIWSDVSLQRQFFESIKPKLGVKVDEDWYSITTE